MNSPITSDTTLLIDIGSVHKFTLRLELDVVSLLKLDVPDDDDDKIQTHKMLCICQYINIYITSFHNICI